jgi:hypothetical protein
MDRPELPEPWFRPADEQAHALSHEALAEIGPDHELAGCGLVPVAACSGCDRVAFQMEDGTFAIVHLTWTGRLEAAPWPTARQFRTTRALLAAAGDHRHWLRSGVELPAQSLLGLA